MPSKLKAARMLIQQQGKQFGWMWTPEHGLRFAPEALQLGYVSSKWNLIDLAEQHQNKEAKKLLQAINLVGTTELYQAHRLLIKRKTKLTGILQDYEERANKIIDEQRRRIKEHRDIVERQLQLQNIFMESTTKAFRQTPLERASITGIKERAMHSVDQIDKALQNPDFLAKTGLLPEYKWATQKLINLLELNIDFDTLLEQQKQMYGDPYKAFEQAFIEVSEQVYEAYEQLSREQQLEIASSENYRDILISMDILDIPIEGF